MLPHHLSTISVIPQIFLDAVTASVEPYSSCSQTFPFLEACLSLSSNCKCPHNTNLVFFQEISPRLTREYTRMYLLFFHSHLKGPLELQSQAWIHQFKVRHQHLCELALTELCAKVFPEVTKFFNTGMPELQIKRMSKHAIKHILISHKKPPKIEWTFFLVCLKFT